MKISDSVVARRFAPVLLAVTLTFSATACDFGDDVDETEQELQDEADQKEQELEDKADEKEEDLRDGEVEE
jgi:hypothetical protein